MIAMKLESKPDATLAMYVAIIVVGSLLMWLARDFSQAGSNVMAGFLLGCMLFGLGVLALIIGESRTVQLDEQQKRIVLEVRRRIGPSKRIELPFSDIRELGIGVQGKPSSGTRYYDLIVRMRSGKEIYLFGGCVFEGRMSRQWIDDLRARFERAVFSA
jgi:hypothetical protein